MTTVRSIITASFKKGGILTKNETPSSDEMNDAHDELTRMLAGWSNDSLLVVAKVRETFSLTSSASYTIGPSGDFNTARPNQIISASLRDGTVDYPISIITDEWYEKIRVKTTHGVPRNLNYKTTFPLGTITLYPVPITSYSLVLLSEKSIGSLGLDDEISLPPGWEDAIVWNLSPRLSIEYAQPIDPAVAKMAMDSKGAIKTAVMRNRTLDANPSSRAGNVYTGWFN
jgi:hypothetical protein